MNDISSRNFNREKYSRQDFVLAIKVRLHVIVSQIFDWYRVSDPAQSCIFKWEVALKRHPSALSQCSADCFEA